MAENEDQLKKLILWRKSHLFGKYRGTVDSVADGDDLGIISVKVPSIWKNRVLKRVLPCSPFAGSKHGFVAIPEPGDGVWIEFVGGNTSEPIWTGFWWPKKNGIPEPKGKLVRTFITSKGHKLILDDDGNEVKLIHADGAHITMNSKKEIMIEIGDSSAKLTSSDITLTAGAVSPQPNIKIEAGQITISAGTVGTVKLTSGGVDIGNGALKIGA